MTAAVGSGQVAAMVRALDIAPANDRTTASAPWSFDSDVVVPLIDPLQRNGSGAWFACVAAAAMLHLAAIGFLGWPKADQMPGGGGTELEAISVDIVQASAIDAVQARATVGAASAKAPLAEREGSELPQPEIAPAPDQAPQKEPEKAARSEVADLVIPDTPMKLDPAPPEFPSITIAPRKDDRKVEAPDKPAEAKPRDDPAPAASQPAPATPATERGGVTSQGVSPVETAAQAAAAAIAGEIDKFGRDVQQAVSRNRPHLPAGRKKRIGQVRIAFGLTTDGAVAYARIQRSSGDTMLDEAALAAVEMAKYPRPPASARSDQLTYTMSIEFR